MECTNGKTPEHSLTPHPYRFAKANMYFMHGIPSKT